MKYSTPESEYLVYLIRSILNGEDIPNPPEQLDIKKFHELAKKQQVDSLVFPALRDNGIITGEELKLWRAISLNEMQKMIVVNAEREAICAQLEQEGIDYMFLKGLIVRNYYPKTSMRQMSDNDILYDKGNRDKLVKIMKSNGYYLGAAAGISDDFYKKPYCTFEFHRELFNWEDDFYPEFNPWKRATLEKGTKNHYIMSKEDNYIYTISHLYKHYHCIDGCGIRFLCDIYLLTVKDNLNFNYIEKTFARFGILPFAKTAYDLAYTLFKSGEGDEDQQALLDFMFSGGVYGAGHFDYDKKLEEFGNSRILYLIKRLFPSRKMMYGNYRTLQRKPYLLPLFYVYRIFDKMKHNRKYLIYEIKGIRRLKKNKHKHGG